MPEIEFPPTDDRGQVGIGTLIVFIAMVLVAAIAAGVLINTADLLQSQAQDTSDQSSQQVTDRIEVNNPIGNVTSDQVDFVNFTVTKAPGSGDIDLTNVTASWQGPSTTTFALDPSNTGWVSISNITDSDGSIVETTSGDKILNSENDRAKVSLDLATASNLNQLNGGSEVTLVLTTADGGSTTVVLNVDPSLSGEQSTRL